MKLTRLQILLAVLGCAFCAGLGQARWQRPVVAAIQIAKGRQTIADRVAQFGDAARARLAPDFARIGAAYPPERMALIGLKSEKTLEVWVADDGLSWQHLRNYPILGMSGSLGPKLKEGDMQVPEGIYRLESLNPNSLYHLSLRVSYPNAEDVRRGRADGRTELGGDIMIHGKECSIGCLAMGDTAAEDLFVLAAETGIDRVAILLSPVDFRIRDLPADRPPAPVWTPQLYESIRRELKTFERPAGL